MNALYEFEKIPLVVLIFFGLSLAFLVNEIKLPERNLKTARFLGWSLWPLYFAYCYFAGKLDYPEDVFWAFFRGLLSAWLVKNMLILLFKGAHLFRRS